MEGAAQVEQLRAEVERLKVELKAKEAQADPVFAYSRSYGRTDVATILESPDQGVSLIGKTLRVGGWVRTGREAGAGAFAFLEVNDGSCFGSIQAMVQKEVAEAFSPAGLKVMLSTGTSVLLEGELARTPEGTKQLVELKVSRVCHVGTCDASSYPIAKKKLSMEFLREKIHLRPRTNTIGVVARVRNALAFATHSFFQQHGFKYVHTPIVTCSDCEGAGEMFQVTTLMKGAEDHLKMTIPTVEDIAAAEAALAEQQGVLAEAREKKDKKKAKKVEQEIQRMTHEIEGLKKKARTVGGVARTEAGGVDYSEDFFGKAAYLTVSGQLEGEAYACALSKVYTFGPTFRAENSNTARHLAEFWMIEPEMAFCDLEDDMRCAEDYVRFCCRYLLDSCRSDLEFLAKMIDPKCIERLEHVAESPFKRVSYTEAIEVLEAAIKEGKKKFEYEVRWGIDLQSEHERYLTEEVFQCPIIVYNYPAEIKAFYMRLNDDGKTVAAMDVLVPKVGELIGGSQREDRVEVLLKKIEEGGMDLAAYENYLDLRRYGTVPHAGFGLGFERLIMFATGIENIRDVIPYPRWPMHAS